MGNGREECTSNPEEVGFGGANQGNQLPTLSQTLGSNQIHRGLVEMRKCIAATITVLICAIGSSRLVSGQSNVEASSDYETGFTSYVEFGGSANSLGQVYELNSSAGYSFSPHFGMDFGLPIYFVNASNATTGSTSSGGVGNPSVDLRWKYPHTSVNYATVLTGAAPLGDKGLGLNTGHGTFDWTNHFDHVFNQVVPFVEAGVSNTTSDSRLFIRPYTSYGLNAHFRGGAEVAVWKSISLGAAGYDISPFGNQTVFSRVAGASGTTGTGVGAGHGQAFNSGHQTTGAASIAEDNGFSTWVDASLNRYTDAQIGYTRSVQFQLNSVSFSLGFNLGRLLRDSK